MHSVCTFVCMYLHIHCTCTCKTYEWVTHLPLKYNALYGLEMVVMVKRRSNKMAADSMIEERELDAYGSSENELHG